MKKFLIFAILLMAVSCSTGPTDVPDERVVGSSSTDYGKVTRIGCIDHVPMGETMEARFHVEITKYESRSWVCIGYSGGERCTEATVPYSADGLTETYGTADGTTLVLGTGTFMATGGAGCYLLER